ncbi:MAG: class I SAM-dependent methyltransferase [Alphaproteobacteria bacterium]|nr:class I SAM-dependent methyltransferase [Alphaproteobacteria bacterium]
MASRPHKNEIAAPSPWVVRFAPLITGNVLDIACGAGRHTRYFLSRGHRVSAVDRDVSRMADLHGVAALELHETDLEDGAGRLPNGQFGGVIVTNYLWRPLLPAIVAAVGEAGVLLYETFADGNATYGKPSNPDFLLQPGELLDAVRRQLHVIAYENGMTNDPHPAIIQRICAVRRKVADTPLD